MNVTLFLILAISFASCASLHGDLIPTSETEPAIGRSGKRMRRRYQTLLRPPNEEIRILLEFRGAITSDPYGVLNDWTWANRFNACTWQGVTCDNESYRVTRLELTSGVFSYLEGTISPGIGGLEFLEALDLTGNNLHGSIPPSLGKFSRLYLLSLVANSLTGVLPQELGLLGNLLHVSVNGNKLTGPIPPEFGNCSALQDLDFSNNHFDGDIPASLGNLNNLVFLDLSNNRLSGEVPAELLILPLLWRLSLSSNNLTGSLPYRAMVNLSVGLTHFSVNGNQLSGAIPMSTFSNCGRLLYLDMSSNAFSGALPLVPGPRSGPSTAGLRPPGAGYDGSDVFGSVIFSNNLFSGTLPPSFGESHKFSLVDISHNNVGGPIPPFCSSSPLSISNLNLGYNLFAGEFPMSLTNCSGMVDLRLNNNFFSGRLPANLSYPSLQRLDLSSNNFSGEIPLSLTGGPNVMFLQVLRLSNNFFTGNLLLNSTSPPSLLESLSVSHNLLTGEIPEYLETCTALQLLDLSWNQFTGQIPNLSEALPSLRVLNLGSNGLSGRLPAWIWDLRQLQILDLSDNMFEGNLPKNLSNLLGMIVETSNSSLPTDDSTLQEVVQTQINGHFVTLTYILLAETIMDLSHNVFSGEIPRELGDLKGLKYLNISRNKLNGRIGESLGSIRGLLSLDLSGNELSGTIPQFLGRSDNLGYLDLSSNNISGAILSTKFPLASYLPGNDHLCGLIVLNRSCTPKSPTEDPMSLAVAASSGTNFDDAVSILAIDIGALIGFFVCMLTISFSQDGRNYIFQFPVP